MKILKKNYKLLIGFILGLVVAVTGVYAATVITSKDISYDNTTSKLSSTNVKDSLDELSTKAELKNRDNIVEGYTYNASTCVTGEESTCVKTDCYKDTTANSCKAGDIIKYKVNDTDIVTFHVMYDNGTTMTMQSQKNTVVNTSWYQAENLDSSGPLTILLILENITRTWVNVNEQTYTMGTTTFKTNSFTGCSSYNNCSSNVYTMESRTARARMITIQEAAILGCTQTKQSCPNWMHNYVIASTTCGGTVDDNWPNYEGLRNFGYWTMSVVYPSANSAWLIDYCGNISTAGNTNARDYGARAVVVISK